MSQGFFIRLKIKKRISIPLFLSCLLLAYALPTVAQDDAFEDALFEDFLFGDNKKWKSVPWLEDMGKVWRQEYIKTTLTGYLFRAEPDLRGEDKLLEPV